MTNKKILIVEDDRDVRLGYHIRLKANHYDTFFAADSVTSMTEARKHQPVHRDGAVEVKHISCRDTGDYCHRT
jgi:hypothetical protein